MIVSVKGQCLVLLRSPYALSTLLFKVFQIRITNGSAALVTTLNVSPGWAACPSSSESEWNVMRSCRAGVSYKVRESQNSHQSGNRPPPLHELPMCMKAPGASQTPPKAEKVREKLTQSTPFTPKQTTLNYKMTERRH